MHVEGERGGPTPAAELGRDQAIGREIGAEPALALGNAQGGELGGLEVGVVLEREARLAVVARGARREVLAAERIGEGDEVALFRRRRDPPTLTLPRKGGGGR